MKNGVLSPDRVNVNPEKTAIVRKWFQVCEAGLAGKVVESNGIGPMFVLKSKYGWQEAAQQVEISTAPKAATPEQIAERYRNAEKPQLIELDESENNQIVQNADNITPEAVECQR